MGKTRRSCSRNLIRANWTLNNSSMVDEVTNTEAHPFSSNGKRALQSRDMTNMLILLIPIADELCCREYHWLDSFVLMLVLLWHIPLLSLSLIIEMSQSASDTSNVHSEFHVFTSTSLYTPATICHSSLSYFRYIHGFTEIRPLVRSDRCFLGLHHRSGSGRWRMSVDSEQWDGRRLRLSNIRSEWIEQSTTLPVITSNRPEELLSFLSGQSEEEMSILDRSRAMLSPVVRDQTVSGGQIARESAWNIQ